MIFFVEVSVVLVCLLVEHLVEVSTRVHFWRLVLGRKLFDGDTQSLYRIVQPGL